MTNDEQEDGATRGDLLQRLALMEAMIAEGRRATARFGWVFLMWGLVDIGGMGWQWVKPNFTLVWPISLAVGFALMYLVIYLSNALEQGPLHNQQVQNRTIAAVWSMMGLAATLYLAGALLGRGGWQISFAAAILMMVGLAHAISAVILRWRVQGSVAALWWAGGIAMFLVRSGLVQYIIVVGEMFFGMVVFGLYAMMLERRNQMVRVQHV